MNQETTPLTRSNTPDSPSISHNFPSRRDHSPQILTPRSKIRALIANFDSESESESPLAAQSRSKLDSAHIRRSPVPRSDIKTKFDKQLDSDSDDDQEENLPVAPRGKLAARMLATTTRSQSPKLNETFVSDQVESIQDAKIGAADPPASDADDSDGDICAFGRRQGRRKSQLSPSPSRPIRLATRSISPLFVPMDSDNSAADHDSDTPIPRDTTKQRYLQSEQTQKAERMQRTSDLGLELGSESELEERDDDEVDKMDAVESAKKFSQPVRSARKTSKKALLEMNRETQRIARNMQLSHQTTTKTKIPIHSFVNRFNQHSKNASMAKGSLPSSSTPTSELDVLHSTPPTSPPQSPHSVNNKIKMHTQNDVKDSVAQAFDDLEEFPTLDELFAESQKPRTQPENRANDGEPTIPPQNPEPKKSRQIRIDLSRESVAQDNSDSDLEIITSPSKTRRLALFENASAKRNPGQSGVLRKQMALANLSQSTKHPAMTRLAHERDLWAKAREQAMHQREERIASLRAKGVEIQTPEQRARQEEEVEDLVEKARAEAEEIAKREKAASKHAGNLKGDVIELDSSADEEEYIANAETDSESGLSEEEEENDPLKPIIIGNEDGDEENDQAAEFIEDQAEEDSASEDTNDEQLNESEADGETEDQEFIRRTRPKYVVSDDEDDDPPEAPTPIESTPKARMVPNLGIPITPILGLSQAFAATIGDDQQETQEDSLAKLRNLPGIDLPVSQIPESLSQALIHETQPQNHDDPIDLFSGFTQADMQAAASPSVHYSEIPDPTQDDGFVMSPFSQKRFLSTPVSSIATTRKFKKDELRGDNKRKLRRGQIRQQDDAASAKANNAFTVMQKAAQKFSKPFDKKKSNAKDMVEEAAEESDDEYAGLGGVSDDASGSEDELDMRMINDNSGEVVDEKQLAALNANHARQRDEIEVNKLLKDITSGNLRRKRGGDALDLSDSDDELIERRRAAKRREFAKARKALLADEKINQLADDPKKQAFFKTIEDQDLDFYNFLQEPHPDSDESYGNKDSSQEGPQQNETEGITFHLSNQKRPFDTAAEEALNRPHAKLRRTGKVGVKELSTAQIRRTVSYLIDGSDTGMAPENNPEPNETTAVLQDHEAGQPTYLNYGTISDLIGDPESHISPVHRNGADLPARPASQSCNDNSRPNREYVNRLSLRRQAVSNASLSTKRAGKFAFQSDAENHSSERRGRPPFIQRHSSSSLSAISSGSDSPSFASAVKKDSVGAPAGRKAAINYYTAAREKEREYQLKKGLDHGGSDISALVAQRRKMKGGLGDLLSRE
ncbi:hypothetical protein FQN57_001531 [Myotisia sp. PD_48]|nr:hypothetical protein FQN57_001531 [Myotisia sp. PD_48]